MVNFCYAYPIIFDNDGAPLRGRLDFCEPGTTTSKNVFDVNGNSLGSSIDTTDEGFPGESQIFIDGATDCRVYKGDELQYVMRLVDVSSHGGTPSGDSSSVGSIEDLRRLSVPDDGTTVTSTGYYVPGDMTPQLYVFSVSSTADDDGGGVVKPDDVEASAAGRWLLVPQKYIDCRAFGIIPFDSAESIDEFYSLTDIFAYAGSVGRDVWFPAISSLTYSYYAITSGTYSCATRICADKGVHFRNTASGNTTSIEAAGIESVGLKFEYGTFNVASPVFRTSWIGSSGTVNYSPSERLVVDSDVSVTASGCKVEFAVSVNHSVDLTGCIIECSGKLSTSYAHSFTSCRVTDRFFSSPANLNISLVSLSGCEFDVDDFLYTANWAKFEMAQGSTSLDFHGRSVASLNISGTSPFTVTNAAITSLVVQSSVPSVELIDCRVSAVTNVNGDLVVYHGAIRFGSSVTITGTFKCMDGVITAASGAEVECYSLHLSDSEVNVKITANVAYVKGCLVAKKIITVGAINVQTVKFIGNVFDGDGTHEMDTEFGAVALNCVWKDNHFGGAAMSHSLSDFASSGNSYVYEGNTGNCLPTSVKGIAATSAQAIDMDEGWRVSMAFQNVSVTLFAIGSYRIRFTYHADVSLFINSSYANAGAASSATVSASAGPVSVPTGGVAFPDIVNDLHMNIKDAAVSTPAIIKGYVDAEVA